MRVSELTHEDMLHDPGRTESQTAIVAAPIAAAHRHGGVSMRLRAPSMSSTRPFSLALVQHAPESHDVVTRIPRPARFSSIALTSLRMWLTPSTSVYFFAWTIVRPRIKGSWLITTASTPSSPVRPVVRPFIRMLELGRSDLGEIRSGTEAGNFYRLASQGVHQRELPPQIAATFPDHLIDLKKVIAWI
jgi:hypothetical protein